MGHILQRQAAREVPVQKAVYTGPNFRDSVTHGMKFLNRSGGNGAAKVLGPWNSGRRPVERVPAGRLWR